MAGCAAGCARFCLFVFNFVFWVSIHGSECFAFKDTTHFE